MKKSSYQWLMQQSKQASRWLFASILISILSGIMIIYQSNLLATIIDRVYLHNETRSTLHPLLVTLLFIILLRSGLSFLRETASFNAAKIVKEKIRKKILNSLLSLSPLELNQLKTGTLTSVLIEQVEALQDFFADYLPQMTITVLLPLIILIAVFTQNWIVGCILLITAPLIPIFMALIGMQTAKLNQENFQVLGRMSAHFLDQLQGLATLTLFNRAESQVNSIQTVSEEFREKTMRILRVAFLSSSALELFATLSIAMIAVYLGLSLLGLMHTQVTLKMALFILLLAPEFFAPLRQLGTFYHARAQAIGAAEEIMKIIHKEKNTEASEIKLHTNKVSLTINNIHFQYQNNKILFNNFNLIINENDCITITGPSGSGKSTLLYLIAKLATPTSGNILANNIDIHALDNDNWRSHIGFLHQNPRLFAGSILDNIRFANPEASDEAIKKAADEAGVTLFTDKLPNQLHTLIGENNTGLSGGQIQRIALARVILKDAPLILLDEPTAYLDMDNKQIISNLLEKWLDKKTIVVATHDEALVESAKTLFRIGEPS